MKDLKGGLLIWLGFVVIWGIFLLIYWALYLGGGR
jgi:hypothetical protein